jgi:hypothetical protein
MVWEIRDCRERERNCHEVELWFGKLEFLDIEKKKKWGKRGTIRFFFVINKKTLTFNILFHCRVYRKTQTIL